MTSPIRRETDVASGEAQDQADVDAYIARNRDALDESIRRSRREIAAGIHETRSIDQIIADGRKRRRAS